MKVLLDTNIVLDYAFERNKFIEDAGELMKMAFEGKITAFISASSVTDIYYIVQKYKTKEKALEFIKKLILFIGIAGVDKIVIENAINSNFADFEDVVQNFSASNNSIEYIITRNVKDFKNSELNVIEPKFFIEQIQKK